MNIGKEIERLPKQPSHRDLLSIPRGGGGGYLFSVKKFEFQEISGKNANDSDKRMMIERETCIFYLERPLYITRFL